MIFFTLLYFLLHYYVTSHNQTFTKIFLVYFLLYNRYSNVNKNRAEETMLFNVKITQSFESCIFIIIILCFFNFFLRYLLLFMVLKTHFVHFFHLLLLLHCSRCPLYSFATLSINRIQFSSTCFIFFMYFYILLCVTLQTQNSKYRLLINECFVVYNLICYAT